MGIVTSKSKRDSKSERKASQSRIAKRTNSTDKDAMLMTALEDAQWNLHNGDGAGAGNVVNGKDEHRDTTRAWIGEEESGGLEKVIGQPSVAHQRSSCGELKIYDVDQETEMTPRATSGSRAEAAFPSSNGDVADVTSYNVDVMASTDEDVGGKRWNGMPFPILPEVAGFRNIIRMPTGGITTAGILNLPSRVSHGDGLPDVECVARGNDRKTSIVESALLARCQALRAAELEKAFGNNASQNGNSDAGPSKRGNPCCPFPGSYACSYGCSFPPSSPALAGDFLRRFPVAGKDGFVGAAGAADGEHFAPDRSSYGAKAYTWVLMASSDAPRVDAPLPVPAEDSRPLAVTLTEQSLKKPTQIIKDQGRWLMVETEKQVEGNTEEQTEPEMTANREVDVLAEVMPAEERVTERSAVEPSYPYEETGVEGDKPPTEQTAEQPNRIESREKLYTKIRPQGNGAPPVEESRSPICTESAHDEDGAADSDETLTEEVAKEDVADRPEELGDIESWYRKNATLHRTSHPSTIPTITCCSRNLGDAELELRGEDTLESAAIGTELSGKVHAGIDDQRNHDDHCLRDDHCSHDDRGRHADAAHVSGDAEKYTEKANGVSCCCIRGDAGLDANRGDALPDHAQSGNENADYATGQQEVLHWRYSDLSTSVTARDETPETRRAEPCLDCTTTTGSGSKDEVATWSDSDVTGNDSDIAWSDAWVTWSDCQAKDKDAGGAGGEKERGERGRKGRRRGRAEEENLSDKTKPSKDSRS